MKQAIEMIETLTEKLTGSTFEYQKGSLFEDLKTRVCKATYEERINLLNDFETIFSEGKPTKEEMMTIVERFQLVAYSEDINLLQKVFANYSLPFKVRQTALSLMTKYGTVSTVQILDQFLDHEHHRYMRKLVCDGIEYLGEFFTRSTAIAPNFRENTFFSTHVSEKYGVENGVSVSMQIITQHHDFDREIFFKQAYAILECEEGEQTRYCKSNFTRSGAVIFNGLKGGKYHIIFVSIPLYLSVTGANRLYSYQTSIEDLLKKLSCKIHFFSYINFIKSATVEREIISEEKMKKIDREFCECFLKEKPPSDDKMIAQIKKYLKTANSFHNAIELLMPIGKTNLSSKVRIVAIQALASLSFSKSIDDLLDMYQYEDDQEVKDAMLEAVWQLQQNCYPGTIITYGERSQSMKFFFNKDQEKEFKYNLCIEFSKHKKLPQLSCEGMTVEMKSDELERTVVMREKIDHNGRVVFQGFQDGSYTFSLCA